MTYPCWKNGRFKNFVSFLTFKSLQKPQSVFMGKNFYEKFRNQTRINPVFNPIGNTPSPPPIEYYETTTTPAFEHDLKHVLNLSLLFFEAQRSGKLPMDNRIRFWIFLYSTKVIKCRSHLFLSCFFSKPFFNTKMYTTCEHCLLEKFMIQFIV